MRAVVYNARKRGEDRASDYFKRTENVAGVKDMRFQALMPDILHWLGITKIDRMLSMSKCVLFPCTNSCLLSSLANTNPVRQHETRCHREPRVSLGRSGWRLAASDHALTKPPQHPYS